MPTGTIGYTTRATTAIGGTDENAWQESPIDPARLVAGTNVIAVEVHQQSPSSTDISFDLELRATEATAPAPTVTLMSPANSAVSNCTDRHVRRGGDGARRARQRHPVRGRAAADGHLQRTRADRGRADLGRHADRQRPAPALINVDGQPRTRTA